MTVALEISVKLRVLIIVYREPNISTGVFTAFVPVIGSGIIKQNIGSELIIFAARIVILNKPRQLSRRLNKVGICLCAVARGIAFCNIARPNLAYSAYAVISGYNLKRRIFTVRKAPHAYKIEALKYRLLL